MSHANIHQTLKEYRVPDIAGDAELPDDAAGAGALNACARFISGVQTAADIAWVSRALTAYLSSAGALPLERCMQLPSTHTAWRKHRRDQWLSRAASLMDVAGNWNGPQKLETEWNTFISRGPWNSWRDDEKPPEYATALSEALFYATRLNHSQSLSAKQICRIVGHVFQMKSR